MNILLANPACKKTIDGEYERYYIRSGSRWPHSGVKRKGEAPHYLPFPFFLAYAAALLKEAGFPIEVLDCVAMDMPEESFLKKIGELKPELVFYEATTPTIDYDLSLARKIKAFSGALVALAGAHPSIFASRIIAENSSIDFILKGEYERTLLDLAIMLRDKSGIFPAGLVYREAGRVVDRGYPGSLQPLEGLPFPLREYFPSPGKPDPTLYWDAFCQNRRTIQLQSSRGCPYRCYFCLWNQAFYNNGGYRFFSSSRVADEIQEAQERYGAQEVYFDDEDFTADKGRVLSICKEISRRGLKVKWSCMGNAMHLDQETLRTMAASKCIGIKFGVESGSEKVLREIGKPMDLKKVKEVVSCCRRLGIKTQPAFTIGLLGENNDDIKRTMRFSYGLDADSIQVSIATPYPGTRFFASLESLGYLKGMGWDNFDGKRAVFAEGMLEDRSKFIFYWFLRKVFSPAWLWGHRRIIARTLKGLGPIFALRRLSGVITDERKNR